jgi:hypothetical protein
VGRQLLETLPTAWGRENDAVAIPPRMLCGRIRANAVHCFSAELAVDFLSIAFGSSRSLSHVGDPPCRYYRVLFWNFALKQMVQNVTSGRSSAKRRGTRTSLHSSTGRGNTRQTRPDVSCFGGLGSGWIPVTHGDWEDNPRFSSDDRLRYFLSGSREGSHRLWAQKVDFDMRRNGNLDAVYRRLNHGDLRRPLGRLTHCAEVNPPPRLRSGKRRVPVAGCAVHTINREAAAAD